MEACIVLLAQEPKRIVMALAGRTGVVCVEVQSMA